MSKTSNIIIRVSEEEKEKANALVELFGKKNVSQFIREIINDSYETLINAPKDKLSLAFYRAELINEMNSIENLAPYERYKYNTKLNLLKELEEKFKE